MSASQDQSGSAAEATLDPRIARSRAVIVAAASEHFLRNGYVAANVDEIAAEANVSKRTVYNIFGGKEQLFREILDDALSTAERFSIEVASVLTGTGDVADELRQLAGRLAAAVLGGPIVRLRRLLIGEVERFPELARDYYQRAPGRVMDALAEALAEFDRRGLLGVEDAWLAAEHFAFLVMGASLDRALFEEPPSAEHIATRARQGADVFLRAYGPTSRAR